MNHVARINTEARTARLHDVVMAFSISGTMEIEWADFNSVMHFKAKRRRVFPKTISLQEIALIALEKHPSVSIDDVKGLSQQQHIIAARRHVIRLIKELRPDASFPEIGRFLNRHHATIISALRGRKRSPRP